MPSTPTTLYDKWLNWLKNQPLYIIGLSLVLGLTAGLKLVNQLKDVGVFPTESPTPIEEILIQPDSQSIVAKKSLLTPETVNRTVDLPAPVSRGQNRAEPLERWLKTVVIVRSSMIDGELFINGHLETTMEVPSKEVWFSARQGKNIFKVRTVDRIYTRSIYLSNENQKIVYVRF